MEGIKKYSNVEEDEREDFTEGRLSTLTINFDEKTYILEEKFIGDKNFMKDFEGELNKKGQGVIVIEKKKLYITLEKCKVKCVIRSKDGKEKEIEKELGPYTFIFDENTDNLKAPIPIYGNVRWWLIEE